MDVEGGHQPTACRATASSSSSKPRPDGREARATLSVGKHGLGQHEVPALGRPAGRIEGKLEERPAADPRCEVEVGEEPDAVRPGVRREPEPSLEHAPGELPGAQEAHCEHRVGLVDVERVAGE